MKKIIYRTPLLSSMIVNSTSCVVAINSINKDHYFYLSPLIFTYIINKKLILKGENLNKIRKILLCIIYLSTILLIFLLNKYIGIFGNGS